MTSNPAATLSADDGRSAQRLARLTGLLFLITYASSIPPVLSFYVPALSDPEFVLGGDFHAGIAVGALLEMVLIAANVGTALALYSVLRRYSETLSLGYVAARLVESGFIAMGTRGHDGAEHLAPECRLLRSGCSDRDRSSACRDA